MHTKRRERKRKKKKQSSFFEATRASRLLLRPHVRSQPGLTVRGSFTPQILILEAQALDLSMKKQASKLIQKGNNLWHSFIKHVCEHKKREKVKLFAFCVH
jgi:hypothetical protein